MFFREFEGQILNSVQYASVMKTRLTGELAKIDSDVLSLKLFDNAIRSGANDGSQYFNQMSGSAKTLSEQVKVLAANGQDTNKMLEGFATNSKKTAEATYSAGINVGSFAVKTIAMLKSMAVVFLVTQAIQLAITIADKLIVTYEEQRTKYLEAKQELEQLNGELETTQNRLLELNKIPNKSVIEQTEYDRLVRTNSELLRRKQLLEAIALSEQAKTYKSYLTNNSADGNPDGLWGTDYMTASANRVVISQSEIEGNLKQAEYYGATDESGNIRDVEKAQAYYEKVKQLRQENSQLLQEAANDALKAAEGIEYVANATEDWQIETNKALTATYLFSDAATYLSGEIGSLGNLLENSDYSGLKDTVIELIGQGDLTGEGLSANVAFSGLLSLLGSLGISAEDVAVSFATYFKEMASGEAATAGLSQQFAEANTYIDNLQASYATLNSAVEEYNKTGSLSIDTVQGILSMNKDYLSLMSFENGVLKINEEAYKRLAIAKIDSMLVGLTTDYTDKIKKIDDERIAVDYLSRKYEELTVNKMLATADYSRQQQLLEDLKKAILEKGISVGTGDTSDPFSDAKALLDIEKSRLEAGMQSNLSSTAEYYNQLESLVRQYYAVGTKEYREYELEVFQGRKAIYEQEITALEHQITLLEKQNSLKAEDGQKDPYYALSVHSGDNDQKIINNYRTIQDKLHKLANSYREVNETENQDLIDGLQKQWWDYEDKIQAVYKSLADSVISYAQKMKQSEQEYIDARISGISSLSGSLSEAIDEAVDIDKVNEVFKQFQERINEVDLTLDPTAYEDAQAIMERSLEILTRQAELEKENTDRKEKQLELEKAKQKLENLMNNRKIKVLQKQADGSWDYVYEADLKEVEDAQKEYNDKKKDYDEWELQQNVRHLRDKYDDLVYGLNRESRALEDSMVTIEATVATALENLKTKFGTDIPLIQGYLTQMIDDIMSKVKSGSGGDVPGNTNIPPSVSETTLGDFKGVSQEVLVEYFDNKVKWQQADNAGDSATKAALHSRNSEIRKIAGISDDLIGTQKAEEMLKKLRGYSSGGINSETGIAMLHGTPRSPELVLNDTHAAKLWNLLTQPISMMGRSISNSGLFDRFLSNMVLPSSGGSTYNFNNLKVELPNVKDGDSAASLFDGLSNFAFQYANKR